jgi:hypothetical protein
MLKKYLKNLVGYKTKRKIVVFSVDDYGNVRLATREAKKNLEKAGLKISTRFDVYDSLENKEDLEMLFDTLESVNDKNGHPAVFSPFALPCNIDFDKIKSNGFSYYQYELLPTTFEKITSENPLEYEGTWNLWKEGLQKGLMSPQFHGREHINIKVFNDKLKNNDLEIITALSNKSFAGISFSDFHKISPTAAFQFWENSELLNMGNLILDGISCFESVFGYKPTHFTPPAFSFPLELYPKLKIQGINFLDVALIQKVHHGKGKHSFHFNYTGKKMNSGLILSVRNVVFEPTEKSKIDWVAYTIKQIEASFNLHRPAIISSHRVNFCGNIDSKNRIEGLLALKKLLKGIVFKWPEVEFLSINQLDKLIINDEDN